MNLIMNFTNLLKISRRKCAFVTPRIIRPTPRGDKSLSRAPKARALKTTIPLPDFGQNSGRTHHKFRYFQIMCKEMCSSFHDFRNFSVFTILRFSSRGRFH